MWGRGVPRGPVLPISTLLLTNALRLWREKLSMNQQRPTIPSRCSERALCRQSQAEGAGQFWGQGWGRCLRHLGFQHRSSLARNGAGVAGRGGQPLSSLQAPGSGRSWAYVRQAEELFSPCVVAACPLHSPVKRDRWWLSFCSWPQPPRDLPTPLEWIYPPPRPPGPQPLWPRECSLTHQAAPRQAVP